MKKQILCTCMAIAMLAPTVYAQDIKINVSGKTIETDTPAELRDGTVFVPISCIVQEMGGKSEWDGSRAIISLGDTVCVYEPVTSNVTKNGAETSLKEAPYISNGRTMVPLDSVECITDCFTRYYAPTGVIDIIPIYGDTDPTSPPEILLKNHNANFVTIPVSWNGITSDGSVYAALNDDATTNIYRPQVNELFSFCFNSVEPDKVMVSMQYYTYNSKALTEAESVPVFKDGIYYEFVNQPIPDMSGDYGSRIYVIDAFWGENVCRYAFVTDNKFIYSAYEDLPQRLKDLHAIGHCVIGNYVYYAVLGDEEGFHRMLLDGTGDIRICDFTGISSSINGSTSIKLTPYGDNGLLCAIQPLQEYGADGTLSGPFPIDYYKIDLSDYAVEPIAAP